MAKSIDPNAPLYKVTDVTDEQQLENGELVAYRKVEIMLPNKSYAYVSIPASEFDAETAAAEINKIAGDIVEVLNMESSIKASEAPTLQVNPDGTVNRMFDSGETTTEEDYQA